MFLGGVIPNCSWLHLNFYKILAPTDLREVNKPKSKLYCTCSFTAWKQSFSSHKVNMFYTLNLLPCQTFMWSSFLAFTKHIYVHFYRNNWGLQLLTILVNRVKHRGIKMEDVEVAHWTWQRVFSLFWQRPVLLWFIKTKNKSDKISDFPSKVNSSTDEINIFCFVKILF